MTPKDNNLVVVDRDERITLTYGKGTYKPMTLEERVERLEARTLVVVDRDKLARKIQELCHYELEHCHEAISACEVARLTGLLSNVLEAATQGKARIKVEVPPEGYGQVKSGEHAPGEEQYTVCTCGVEDTVACTLHDSDCPQYRCYREKHNMGKGGDTDPCPR